MFANGIIYALSTFSFIGIADIYAARAIAAYKRINAKIFELSSHLHFVTQVFCCSCIQNVACAIECLFLQ